MPGEIKQVAVIGSGVMGSRMAAHITNAGIPVLLLDKETQAKTAMEELQKAVPPAFTAPANADLITTGSIDDDLGKVRDADWIIELVPGSPEEKRDLYKRIDAARKPGSIVSSSASTPRLSVLIEGQSEAFARDFMVTRFFDPPRYVRLVEVVAGGQTRSDAVEIMNDFCDHKLGKRVIQSNDTPGFVADRLGMLWLRSAVNAAVDLGLSVEEADEVCEKTLGTPETGVFGWLDLMGHDYIRNIGKSLTSALPPNDPFCVMCRDLPVKGRFYRETGESINLQTGEYKRPLESNDPTIAVAGESLRALCEAPDKIGRFAWRMVSETLLYAFQLVPATVADITEVDEAMRLAYGWQRGPFELIDRIGAAWLMERLLKENRPIPELLRIASDKSFYRVNFGKLQYLALDGSYRNIRRGQGVLLLSDIKLCGKPVLSNGSSALWDIGDGVLCLEFTGKANAIDGEVLAMIDRVRELIGDGRGALKGVVIHNEGTDFSLGADINFLMNGIKNNRFDDIEKLIKQGQTTFHALRFAPFPSVAAPLGKALGGGCELTLHCSAVQASAETGFGLVECGIGLIPGWGGCTQLLGRAFETQKRGAAAKPAVNQVFETISLATVTTSAAQARELQYLRPSDGITMNADRVLYDAKQKVLELSKDYRAPNPWQFSLPGPTGRAALDLVMETAKRPGKTAPRDFTVWKALAAVLCGGENPGPITETQLMELESKEFLRLVRTTDTASRLESILTTGAPQGNERPRAA